MFSTKRFRLYPEAGVADRMTAWCHTARALWNLALEHRQTAYTVFGRSVTRVDQNLELTALRSCVEWIKDLPAQAGQAVLVQMDQAYNHWWRNPRHFGAPEFKRKGTKMSFSLPGQAVSVRRLNRRWAEVRLPKLGWVRFRLDGRWGDIKDEIRFCTVTYKAGRWHVSFVVIKPLKPRRPEAGTVVGIDVGVANSVTLSRDLGGERRFNRPPTLTAGEKRRLLGLERRKARQVKGSNRYRQTCEAIAKLKARQARVRLDWTHKMSDRVASSFEAVWVEDLRIASMTRSARGTMKAPGRNVRAKSGLNRSVRDEQWGELFRQLGYKAVEFGKRRPHGSSVTCATHRVRGVRAGETFECPICGPLHADENAAVNIETGGHLDSLNSTQKPAKAAACTTTNAPR